MVLNSEQSLEISMTLVDGERKVRGVIGVPQSEGPFGSAYNLTLTPRKSGA